MTAPLLITQTEAAALLGVSPVTVAKLIKKGKLRWLEDVKRLSRAQVEAFARGES